MYNYREEMYDDVKRAVEEWHEWHDEVNDLSEHYYDIYDDLWVDDSVTGNGSGSYTFNSYRADDYVHDNFALACEAYTEFGGCANDVYDLLKDNQSEIIDVTIRCYLLSEVLSDVLEYEF